MKFLFFWRKKHKKLKNNDALSHFLLNASDAEKKQVFIEAAHRANKDQLDLVRRSEAAQ